MASSGWTQFQPWQNQPLPAGWEARYDANVRRYYFIDHSTHKTTWEDPRVKKPEAIPMSQFKASSNAGGSSSLLETSFGGSSSQSGASARQKTSPAKTTPAEPARPSSFEYDDDFPSVSESFLAEMFKGKSEEDKENVKRKLIREFPDVDEVVIEVALRTAKHDESRARELIKKLKGDDDKKSEPSRTKKQEPSKAKGPTAKSSAASKSIEDVSKTKGKAPAKTKSSSQESLDKTKTSAPAAKAKSSSRESLDHLTKVAVVSMPAHPSPPPPSSITLAGLISDTSAVGSSMSVSEMTGRSQQKPSVTQTKQITQTKIYAGRGKVFKSSLLCAPNGSNPANAKGPNPMLLLPEWVQPAGPQRQNRKGPVRSNRQGPARRTQNCGPQASNRTGPVPNMAKGSIYGQSPLASYV